MEIGISQQTARQMSNVQWIERRRRSLYCDLDSGMILGSIVETNELDYPHPDKKLITPEPCTYLAYTQDSTQSAEFLSFENALEWVERQTAYLVKQINKTAA